MINNPSDVNSRQTFTEFVRSLNAENKQKWEGQRIDDFLERLSVYAEDIDGYYKNNNISVNPDKPSWRLFADMLRGASIYE